jgi:hypothetical protein
VRETEALAGQEKARAGASGAGRGAAGPVPPRPLLHPRWRELQDRLERHFGTRVVITPNPGAGGSIRIDFGEGEDFNRIYDRLLGK